jgi:NADH-quinone oxidoreductase subunit H
MLTWMAGFILLIVKLALVLGCMLFLAAYLVWVERKLLARLQVRYGPNRAGKFGLLQPIADSIKMMTKEDIVPEAADRVIFLLAPAVVAVTALLMFAVVPFGSSLTLWGREIPLSMWGYFTYLPSLLWGYTVLPWGAGPPIQNSPCWAASGERLR